MQECYAKLKINGFLIFDLQRLEGITRKELFSVFDHMKKAGYAIILNPNFSYPSDATAEINSSNSLIIIKKIPGKPELNFSLLEAVGLNDSRVIYKITKNVGDDKLVKSSDIESKELHKVKQELTESG